MTVLPARYDTPQPSKGQFSAIVYIDGSQVVAEDADGRVIARGIAGIDDVKIINTAIDGGGIIVFGAGTFVVSSALTRPSFGISFFGIPGKTVFDCSGIKQNLFTIGQDNYAHTSSLLAADSIAGTSFITIASTSTYSIGDFIKIWDSEAVEGYVKGEIVRIENIVGNVISVSRSLRDSYITAQSAAIRKLTMISSTQVSGIKFIGPGEETDPWAINAYLICNSVIENCEFYNWGYGAVCLTDSVNCIVQNNIFRKIFKTGLGYSVYLGNASEDISIINNRFIEKGRHYIATGGSNGTYLSGGWPKEIVIMDNYFENSTDEAVNTHDSTRGTLFVISNTFESCSKGIEFSNSDCIISENEFIDCSNGIALYHYENIYDLYCIISNNIFRRCIYDIYSEYVDNISIHGNYCTGRTEILYGSNISISNNSYINNPYTPIEIAGTSEKHEKNFQVIGNFFRDQLDGHAISISYVDNIMIHDNYLNGGARIETQVTIKHSIKNNVMINGIDYGFRFYDAQNVYLNGNHVETAYAPLLMDHVSVPATEVFISNNYFSSLHASDYSGYTNVKLDKNTGLCSYSSGQSSLTASNTFADITHGLVATPTKIRIIWLDNIGDRKWWVSTINNTTFRINFDVYDTINHSFLWEAEI